MIFENLYRWKTYQYLPTMQGFYLFNADGQRVGMWYPYKETTPDPKYCELINLLSESEYTEFLTIVKEWWKIVSECLRQAYVLKQRDQQYASR